ncbi:hydrolase [Thermanaerothrix daxensis]|uniref:Hydrolase n=1 Tax=Thermanaerothrix daxensis TaxID=869279 RepID=A0A0P6Y1X8_9CHLR|nr:putative aminohydrolase SsnA [Thermanaerothrix daxensis]KPL83118.1 hydrolase [Thermanaerothrix daxensis]
MLITNGTLITWESPNRILENHTIYIDNERIQEIGPTQTLLAKYPQEERLDAKGQYVMPGNICAHTHFYGAFARGLAIPGPAPADFPEILEKLWWSLDKSLSHEAVYYSAMVCLVDAIRHGTTTLIDHHASPNAIAGSLDDIARAVEQSGVRASLCYEVTDRDGPERAQAGIEENLRFIEYVKREHPLGGRLSAMFGLHASLTLGEATLRACRERVGEDVGFHIHVAEHPVDEYDSLHRYGERVVDRLYRHGILGPRSIVVHAVHVDVREINLLAETGTWVTHQPRSNMNNAVGMAMTEGMLRAGVKVCLGNDGFSNAMWEEWKAAYLAHKLWHLDPRRMPATDVVKMAIYNNAALATQQFNCGPIGVIAPGAQADLIFVDYHPFTPLTPDNLPWHIVFGFHESMVTTTIVAGKVLMRERELLTLDAEKIAYEARQLAPRIWERYHALF